MKSHNILSELQECQIKLCSEENYQPQMEILYESIINQYKNAINALLKEIKIIKQHLNSQKNSRDNILKGISQSEDYISVKELAQFLKKDLPNKTAIFDQISKLISKNFSQDNKSNIVYIQTIKQVKVPTYIEVIKQIQKPIVFEKVKNVQKIIEVQKQVFIEKKIEVPIFSGKIAQKFLQKNNDSKFNTSKLRTTNFEESSSKQIGEESFVAKQSLRNVKSSSNLRRDTTMQVERPRNNKQQYNYYRKRASRNNFNGYD